MIIASSKNVNCINNLFSTLEYKYKHIKDCLNLNIGHTSRIEIIDEKISNIADYLINEIKTFCDGYCCGWESYIDNPDYNY